VYGDWPKQPANIVPFFTSILTEDQIKITKEASQNRVLHNPARILFVGRLDRGKNAHILIDALFQLKQNSIPFEARIIGDGDESERLHNQAKDLNLGQEVIFSGAIPFSDVLESYRWSDFLVLTSENAEGWPKAISEGMAFGLVCFGSQRGLIPQMLDNGRGKVIWPVTAQNLSTGLQEIISSPDEYVEISKRAATWSQAYSLEDLREAIKQLLQNRWHLDGEIFDQTLSRKTE
jgi:glycosyltransferase involved in cell wall biosynthesis